MATSNLSFDRSTDNTLLASHYNISQSQKPSIHFDTLMSNQSITGTLTNQNTAANNDSDNITSILQSFTLGLNSSQQDLVTTTYSLRISNLPKDITKREAFLIFALAENVLSINLLHENEQTNSPTIVAKFNSLQLATRYAKILSNKNDLFGFNSPNKLHIEMLDDATQKQVPYSSIVTSSTFNIPTITQQNTQQNQPQSIALGSNNKGGANRGSLLPQLSRFSFNDPFTLETNPQEPTILKSKSSAVNHIQTNYQESNAGTRDAGKSFLFMENDEINNNIWGSNTLTTSIHALSNTPQSSTSAVPWGSNAITANLNNGNSNSNSNSSSNNNTNSNDVNRKQSSTFYLPMVNGSTAVQTTTTLPGIDLNQQFSLNNISNTFSTSTASIPTFNGLISQMGPSQSVMASDNTFNQQGATQLNTLQHTTPVKNKLNSNINRHIPSHGVTPTQSVNSNNKMNSSTISLPGATGTVTMSEADLSLLAKVPPPANPADQNPPCNTLYVGNLPPDATEQELRQLFSGQEGFRRLSFRNKNGNGNGHGPMCFVEFEDISYATRALAELYGRKLPRTTSNNKGGIRLSFSKNPLGVRGPNSKRNGNSNSNPNNSNNTNNLNNNGNRSGSTNTVSNNNNMNNMNNAYTTFPKNP